MFKIYLRIFILSLSFISNFAFGSQENYFYEVQFGNLIVGQAEVNIKKSNKIIELNSKSKTAGVLNVFYEYEGELSSSSVKKGDIWFPNKFLTRGILNNKLRSSTLYWSAENAVSYENNPILDLKKVHAIDKETLKRVADPITAFINVIERIDSKKNCDTSFKIFDGRRRYDLKIKTLGKENLVNDRPKSFSGNVTTCGVKMIPIGGHRLKSKWKPKQDKFSDFKIYFGKTSSGLLFPVRMNLERWFGTVVVRLINKNM